MAETSINMLVKELRIKDKALELACVAMEGLPGFCHECEEVTGINCDVTDPSSCIDDIKQSFITKAKEAIENETK